MFLKPPPGLVEHSAQPLTRANIILIVLALLAPLALYFDTARSIVSIWDSSDTFAHGYAIVPISLWLIWRRRVNFSLIPATPAWPALALLALAGAGWLAARIGGVQVVMQYAFVVMFPLVAFALLGRRLAGSLAFPLLFLLFAVPFGEVFVDPLIHITADFTVWAVQVTGIPVLRNGTRFELPTGSWSVVEACSGVRYLISSVTLGCLYAYLTYRSNLRRALFIGLSIVVPIIANGLRAYMIVMIGHLSGMELATGVDHLIYGWLFFGLVMFLMFWIGSYWREEEAPAPSAAAAQGVAGMTPVRSLLPIALASVAIAAVWPVFAAYNDRANHNTQAVALGLPQLSGLAAAADFPGWQPDYMAPDARVSGVYMEAARPVRLQVLYYRNQDKSKNLISSLNRLAGPKDAWHATASSIRSEPVGAVRESTMAGPGGPLLVWDWMSINGHHTTSNIVGKLRQAQGKLLFQGDDGALIVLATPVNDDPEAARAALRAFLARGGDAIEATLQQTREH
ncbi:MULTISPECIES: exosortase A [unclassified Massilia]|uniref:exosortase A n=1 Tax=unclassified Massilia TaxID=2609279 RepID=UPI0017823A66|nr:MULTISPECIES: exosortase A [unclassified Massilia]MBD8531326.1 exosortase A [Massilia sp. CFBP 13647]MBD8674419.1 exosortase A [Massilia sp. CFBP 13721]